jgi:predicted nucleic acid-binding protein
MLRNQGQLIEDMDLLIGATARALDLTLVTGNVGHFQRIPDVRMEQWS